MADEASVEGPSSSQCIGESSESTIEIKIKTLDSQIYTFRVTKDLPVLALKEKIVDATGLPVEQQRLIFRGKVLKDDHLLSAYHLEDGHTLHLVAKQPVQAESSPGMQSENAARNFGNEPTGGLRNRVGQVSHGVVLGSVNVADTGEGLVADISRLVGAALNSLAMGNISSTGGASGTSFTSSNQSAASAEPEATQNSSGRTQPGNPAQPAYSIQNHQRQPLQFPNIARLTAIPDSLTTLSEFINRMELALQYGGHPQRSDTPSENSRGIPTPDVLRTVLLQAQQLLTENAATALSHIAGRLDREGTSTDQVVRGQIQSEAIHVGVAMQHLGAMFLELGRTIMTLRMGQSPAEALVNAGPAVYISPTGPNPIMVQPSPLQSSSLFGAPSPLILSGLSSPFVVGDPSRNVNIQIHAGTSVAPGVSSVGSRANSGEAIRGERSNVEHANANQNGSGVPVPTRGLPSRTVVAAIPARSAAETTGHVFNVIYPVQVRSQQSVPSHLSSAQASRPSASNESQPNTVNNVPQPSSESDATSTLVAQINAHMTSAFSGNTQGQSLSMSNGSQPHSSSPSTQTSVNDTISRLVQMSSQLINALPVNGQGPGSSPGIQQTQNQSEGPEAVPPASLSSVEGRNDVNHQPNIITGTEVSGDNGSGKSSVPDTDMPSVVQQLPPEVPESQERSDMGSTTTESVDGPATCQASDTLSNKQRLESSEQNLNPVPTLHTQSTKDRESVGPPPLGLGLGGLKPKRRGKPAKPTSDIPPANQNQQSIARGQEVLRSLVSQNGKNTEDVNGSSVPLPPVTGQIMDGIRRGEQGSSGQIDSAMISHVLQSPGLNSLLSGVAQQSGLGSPSTLRNMLEQCTGNPGVMNTLNDIVQHVGQNEDIGGMLSGMRGGNGGIDFSRMIQQMMPVVSQALGGDLARLVPVPGSQSEPHNVTTRGNHVLDDRISQIDLQQIRDRVEEHDSAGNVFRAMLGTVGDLLGEGNNYEDLVEELGNNAELTDGFMEMLRRRINQRLQTEAEDNS